MTTTREGRPPATGTGLNENATTTLAPEPIAPERAAVPLLAAVLVSPAAKVAEVLALLDVGNVDLIDRPSAVALRSALALAAAGTDPDPVLLLDELQRAGHLAEGHLGGLIRGRLLDASTMFQPAERLRPLAAALAAQLLRARGVAAGEAIAQSYTSASEGDAYALLRREGAAVRALNDTVTQLRGAVR